MIIPAELPNCIALFTLERILLLFEVKPVLIISDLSTVILNGVEYFLVKTDNVADKIFSLSASTPASPVARGALSLAALSFHQKHDSLSESFIGR